MANDTTLEAVIRLRDEMSSQLNSIQREMRDLNNTSDDINEAMRDVQRAVDDAGDALGDLGDIAQETNSSLQDTNGAAEEAAQGIRNMNLREAGEQMLNFAGKIKDAFVNLLDLTEQTKEFNSLTSKLEGASVQNGYDVKTSQNLAKEVYSYTGDDMMAVNVVTNLQWLDLPQNELDETVSAAIATWTAYGDSIPIEGLTESINETAQVGKVTGSLADALNWTAGEEDAFNKKLEACKTTQERAALITDTLNGKFGESKRVFEESNSALMDYQESQWEANNANAQLGETLAPINSAINDVKSAIAEALAPALEQIAEKIQPVIDKISEFIQDHPEIVTAVTIIAGVLGVLAGVIGGLLVVGAGLSIVIGAISAPILIVVGVITAIIAAGIALWMNWDTIKQKAGEIWGAIKDKISEILESIKQWIGQKWEEIKAITSLVWKVINFSG